MINTDLKTSSSSFAEPTVNFSSPIVGSYQILHTDVEDGRFPVIWNACNILHVTRDSDSSDWIVALPDLNTSEIADVITYFQTYLEADLTFLTGSSTVMATSDDGATYTITFSEDLTFALSNPSSSLSQIFGYDDISTSSNILTVPGYHLDDRPHMIAIDVQQAADKMAFGGSANYANLIVSTRDESLVGHYLNFPTTISSLTMRVYRLNVPNVICPMNLPFKIIAQRPLVFSTAS